MNDLKSQHAVEPNGVRHIVGRQCDSADALDHRETLHMSVGCEHVEFSIDFSSASSMISASCIGGTCSVTIAVALLGRREAQGEVGFTHCREVPLCRLDHFCLRRLLRYSGFPFRPAVKIIFLTGP